MLKVKVSPGYHGLSTVLLMARGDHDSNHMDSYKNRMDRIAHNRLPSYELGLLNYYAVSEDGKSQLRLLEGI